MTAQAGRSPRFCVLELWQVQDIPDAYRTHSAVLCIVFMHNQKKKERKKEKEKELSSRSAVPGLLGLFVIHCKKLI
jgi:hypothetical protein